MSTKLTDGVVALRPIEPADAIVYVAQQDGEMAARFEWEQPVTVASLEKVMERWRASWANDGDERNFAIELAESGEMIGDCEVELRADGFVNVMYVVFAPWRRAGYATRAVRLLADFARGLFPGRPLLFRIHPDNAGSIAVARSVCAVREGTEESKSGSVLGRWVAPDEVTVLKG